MESWIGEVRSLANRLTAIDVKLEDEDIIVILTAGLPASYTTVVTSFDALDADKLMLDFIITRLLNEEGRQTTKPLSENTALVTKRSHDNVQCFYCLMKGHYASECPQKTQDIQKREEEGRQKILKGHTATFAELDTSDSEEVVYRM